MFISFMKRGLLLAAVVSLLVPPAAQGASDKQLARQRGSVTYKDTTGASHPVSGSIVLADDATAQTGRASAALLSLPDSSEVALGENTSVKVGAFNEATAVSPTKITVDHGALKFAIHHPAGAKSNYQFTTPTSQIAVRGTEGYLIVGDKGTQVVCTKCEPGDVTVRVAEVVTALVTGQVFTVLGPTGATTSGVSAVSSFNNPAVNQFSNGANPFGNAAASSDATGSASGVSSAASAGASAGAVAGGTAVAGAAAAGVAVAAAANNPPSPTPSVVPAPTSAPITIGPTSLLFTQPGQQQVFMTTGPATVTSGNPAVAVVVGSGTTFFIRAVQAGSATLIVSGPGGSTRVMVTVLGTNSPQGRPQ